MTSEIDLSQFWCWNEECPDYGKQGHGNIIIKQRYGKDNRALLKCRTCKYYFSETRGTVFFGLDTPREEVLRTLAMIPEKGSIRGVARATGHDKDTISKWLEIAGTHCDEVTKYFLQDLNLTRVEVDEIWEFIKKQKNLKNDDPEEYGNVYSLTAIKSETRLFLCHHEGSRTAEDAMELFTMVEQMRSKSSLTPVFVSDDWDPFEEGLVNIYGIIEVPPYKGIGRKPLPRLIPPKDLKYVKIEKKKVEGIMVETVQNIVFGNKKDILKILKVEENGHIGTSYVERFNLTIRASLARFIRKGMNFSKKMRMHTKALDLFQAWYNFVKPHDSLKIKINCGNRRWRYRTPAMAEKFTDHIWNLGELLGFRVPVK